MSPPVAVAVIYTCLSLIYFFWIGWEGSKRISSYDDFFLSGRSVSGRSFQYTLVSGTTSFATVLLYFITASEAYGIFFVANLVTFLLGQYFFFYVATKSTADLSEFSTLSKFVLEETGSKTISRWVNLLTVLGFVGVLFLELLVGSTVFSYVIPGEYSELIGFGVIAILMMSYISIGGFAAVVESDSWQYQLIILACAVILIFVFFVMPFKTGDFSLGRAVSWSVSVDVWLTLLLQATVVNFTLPFCQLSSWERVASTGEWETVRNNYAPALIKIGLIWTVFIVFGLSLNGVGEASSDIGGVFSYVISASNLSAYIIFPVLFGGLVSALISTADSAAIAIVFSLSEGVLFPSFNVKSKNWSSQRKVYSLTSLVIVVVLFAAFFFFQYGARSSFLHLIFAFFNLLIPLFPVVYYLIQDERVSLRDKHKRLSKSDEFRASIGIASGVIVVIALTVTGIYVGSLTWTQLGSVVAVLTTLSISSSALKT